jgi:hypothetical protein
VDGAAELSTEGNGPTVPVIGAGVVPPSARMDWVGTLGVSELTSSRTAVTVGSGATWPPSAVTPASEPTASTAPVALASRMRGEVALRSMGRPWRGRVAPRRKVP